MNVQEEPTILITNDDGITAPGICALVESIRGLGRIVVVAPDRPQSGMGHAVTIGEPIRCYENKIFAGVEAYSCSGTPVDCVKLAVNKIIGKKPNICLSGINHGANHAINVIYSGTMSAAIEAGIENIPAIGFSLLNYSMQANFGEAKNYIRKMANYLLTNQLPKHFTLNVNIPAIAEQEIKGIKICRQAYAKYSESFYERTDPHGNQYYWLTGALENLDTGTDTDVWALANNYISVVPVQIDLTDYTVKKMLEQKFIE